MCWFEVICSLSVKSDCDRSGGDEPHNDIDKGLQKIHLLKDMSDVVPVHAVNGLTKVEF